MSKKRRFNVEETKGFTMFVKSEEKGACPLCPNNVYTDELFVEIDCNIYHLSCYNDNKSDGNNG